MQVLKAYVVCLFLFSLPVRAQNVSGTLKGVVTDPTAGAIAGAAVRLSSVETGVQLKTSTNATGAFVFPSVLAGIYKLEIEAPGFQRHVRSGVSLTANEVRDLGEIGMTIGEVQQSVNVADTPTPLQLASGEKSGLVTGAQLNELALKGRDFFALTALMPGIVDNRSDTRESASGNAGGIFINGARSETKNFTVDGISVLDTGDNQTLHGQPNMDTIAEVKVLTSNYPAEYGRSAGGLVSVVTRGGSREFRGTAWWNHRNEALNANQFFRNRSGLDKVPYRYNIAGFSVGGPLYLPGKFNTDRSKLFFFASQEYTRRRVDYGNQFRNMPTEAERGGDFSRSYDVSGRLISVRDPLTGTPFAGNLIPGSRINALGGSILKFFPLPNYTDPDPALRYRQNYRAAASGPQPRRNDFIRFDIHPSDKLHGYFRWVNDADSRDLPFQGFNFAYTTVQQRVPGHSYAGHASYTFSPSLLNEVTVGKGWDSWQFSPMYPDQVRRSKIGALPQWFPNQVTTGSASETLDAEIMPNLQFGGTPVNSPAVTVNNMQHTNHNDIWEFTDNLSWIRGSHSFKTGIYVVLTDKVQVHGNAWNGVLNFGVGANNPFDSGHGYANTLLGNFNTYTESTRGINFHAKYETVEFFAQDNWRVNRRLTIDYGVRFYRIGPQRDLNFTYSAFDSSSFDPAKAPRLYAPGFDARNVRVGVDRITGATVNAALIGKYVPGTGDYANGMRVGGQDGFPEGMFTVRPLAATPRFGFAYDLFGTARTVLRGGIGVFLDRSRQLVNVNTVTNPPGTYQPTAYYGQMDTLAQSSGAIGPSLVRYVMPEKNAHHPSITSFSFGLQQQLPGASVLDVSYVGNVSSHLLQARSPNQIPMFSRFSPANADPTLKGQPLPDDFFRPYPGLSSLTAYEFAASSNYHSFQVSAQRRFTRNLGFGTSYTWSKVLGVADAYTDTVSSYFKPREWDYGPLPWDRSHVFTVNYLYDLPKPGAATKNRLLAAIFDGWSVSGITTFSSGAALTPGMSTTVATDLTGSSEGARITVVGDPRLPKSERSFYRNFRSEAFALTPVGSFGNAGTGILRQPGINNWDISLTRRFPLGLGERRNLSFRAEFYNAFNHTQFSSLDGTARFDPAGRQVNPTFGAFNDARNPRIISFTLRLQL